MSNNLPSFNFSGMTLKSDDELKDALKGSTGDDGKFFKPGKHEVQIASSEYVGPCESDDTWGRVKVVFEGTGGKTINKTLMIPFKDITAYRTKEGKNSAFPGRVIKGFLEALGADVTIKTLGSTLQTYFGKDNALVGLNLAIEVGYEGNHVKYVGKNAAGEGQVTIVDRKGEQLSGVPLMATYKDANEYAAANNVGIKKFPDITGFAVSSTPNKRPKADW